jgi:hypothetical protein
MTEINRERVSRSKLSKRMKNITKLLLVASAAVALTSQASAHEPALSPRAQANQMITVPRSGSDPDIARDQNALGVAAKAKASAKHSVIAGTASNDRNLVRSKPSRVGSPKVLQQLQESGREFQVAPLK